MLFTACIFTEVVKSNFQIRVLKYMSRSQWRRNRPITVYDVDNRNNFPLKFQRYFCLFVEHKRTSQWSCYTLSTSSNPMLLLYLLPALILLSTQFQNIPIPRKYSSQHKVIKYSNSVQTFSSAPTSQIFPFSANILLSTQFLKILIQCKYCPQHPVSKHSHSVQTFSSAPSSLTF
jgi:hypothetical protein